MKKRMAVCLAAVLLLAVLLTGCGEAQPQEKVAERRLPSVVTVSRWGEKSATFRYKWSELSCSYEGTLSDPEAGAQLYRLNATYDATVRRINFSVTKDDVLSRKISMQFDAKGYLFGVREGETAEETYLYSNGRRTITPQSGARGSLTVKANEQKMIVGGETQIMHAFTEWGDYRGSAPLNGAVNTAYRYDYDDNGNILMISCFKPDDPSYFCCLEFSYLDEPMTLPWQRAAVTLGIESLAASAEWPIEALFYWPYTL